MIDTSLSCAEELAEPAMTTTLTTAQREALIRLLASSCSPESEPIMSKVLSFSPVQRRKAGRPSRASAQAEEAAQAATPLKDLNYFAYMCALADEQEKEREQERIRKAAELVGEGWEALDKEVKEALVAVEKAFDEVEDAEKALRENVEAYEEAQSVMQIGERRLADAKAELRFAELRAWLMQMLGARGSR